MQAGIGELHLGLDPRYPCDLASLRDGRQIPEQGGLANASLTAQDQHTTLARTRFYYESIQHLALAVTIEQPRP
jgi:hypothetical protein